MSRKSHSGRVPARANSSKSGEWLYGHHAVMAALANTRRHCLALYATPNAVQTLGAALTELARQQELRLSQVGPADLDRMLPPGAVHQGIALQTLPLEDADLDACIAAGPALVVVLDQVTDPHNVGAILRSAAAFGALAMIVTERHAPTATGTLAKAASGALEVVPIVRVTNLARTLDDLGRMGYWRVGLDADGPGVIGDVVYDRPTALVMGAEGSGLRRLTRENCDEIARLPMSGRIESLNVSNAAAVALYEFARRATK